ATKRNPRDKSCWSRLCAAKFKAQGRPGGAGSSRCSIRTAATRSLPSIKRAGAFSMGGRALFMGRLLSLRHACETRHVRNANDATPLLLGTERFQQFVARAGLRVRRARRPDVPSRSVGAKLGPPAHRRGRCRSPASTERLHSSREGGRRAVV